MRPLTRGDSAFGRGRCFFGSQCQHIQGPSQVGLEHVGPRCGEPALQAAQEAAGLYRELAAARPDVFTPDLARSLYVLALRTEEAAASAESGIAACQWAHESLTVLIPAFLLLPDAHGDLLRGVRHHYLRLCKAIDTLPDEKLLEPLLPFFSTTGSDT